MAKVKLPSGREVEQATYDRFSEPLDITIVAGPRKTALIFILDQYSLPWTWESSEGVLEKTLQQFDKRVYEQFLRDHSPEPHGRPSHAASAAGRRTPEQESRVTFTDEGMEHAIRNLETRKDGLERYDFLQRSVSRGDVASDTEFHKTFKSFYKVRRGSDWCSVFFSILEREKHDGVVSFGEVLNEMYSRTGRIEASFSSKLIATINTHRPVWDKHVLDNIGLRPPYAGMQPARRLCRCVELYSSIQTWTSKTIRKTGFEKWRRRFDRKFPRFCHFTDIKKLDLFLWQSRG